MDRVIKGFYEQHRLESFVPPHHIDEFRLRRIARGRPILEVDEPVDSLHFFVEGSARVFVPSPNGRQLLLCFYEPLQIFGDLEIIEGAPLATTTVEALTECACLTLERSYVMSRIASDSEFLRALTSSLARKLDRVIRNSALNLLHPVEERLTSYILATTTPNKDGAAVFSGNLTQIAGLLGTSFRHLHRTLNSLCDEGVLVKTGHAYLVLNMDALRSRAAGVYVLADGPQ